MPRTPTRKKGGEYAPETPKPYKKSPTKKKQTPSPVKNSDPSTWRRSRIPSGDKITKTDARKLYRLTGPNDLADLAVVEHYETAIKTSLGTQIVIAHLYDHRSVERKAWEKHGGPENFDAYLSKLRSQYEKRHGSTANFPAPPSYEPVEAGVFIMSLPRGMTVDIHAFSGALQALKQRFPTPWMWERCNEALGDRDDDTTFHTTSAGRVKQLNNAIKDLDLYDYPARPAHLVPSSHSVDQLREVLSRAPRPNTDDPGIEEHFDGFTGDTWWTWQVSYYDELFRALNDVIDVHGVGDDGWKSVRWEVYDKYSDTLGGIQHYHERCEDSWWDSARIWLQGRLREPLDESCSRGKCPSGVVYNTKLPRAS